MMMMMMMIIIIIIIIIIINGLATKDRCTWNVTRIVKFCNLKLEA